MINERLSRLASLPPLRRAAAGAIGGFVACLLIQWIERAVHLLAPLTDLSLVLVDIVPASIWAILCLLVFAGVALPTIRAIVLILAALPILGFVAWLNSSALHGPEAFGVLLPTIFLVATVGVASAFLGNWLDRSWSGHETS